MDWYQTTHNKEYNYNTILYFDCIYIDRLSIFNWWWVNTCDADPPISLLVVYLGTYAPNLYGFVSVVIMDLIIMKNYHNGHGFGFSFLDPAYWIGGETL